MIKIVYCIDCSKQLGKNAFYKKTKRCIPCHRKYATTEDVTKIVSKKMKILWQNPEYRKHMSDTRKGKPGYWKDKKMPKILREKLSKSHKGQVPWHKGKKRPEISGTKHFHWKGGRYKDTNGYILIYQPNHPFVMESKAYIYEHRFVVEQQIGRYLKPSEKCHHINGIKNDNRPQNLMAFINNVIHKRFHKNPNLVKSSEIIFDGRKL